MLVTTVAGRLCTSLVKFRLLDLVATLTMLNFDTVASAGNEGVVRELLGAGANVKSTNDKGLTPL